MDPPTSPPQVPTLFFPFRDGRERGPSTVWGCPSRGQWKTLPLSGLPWPSLFRLTLPCPLHAVETSPLTPVGNLPHEWVSTGGILGNYFFVPLLRC